MNFIFNWYNSRSYQFRSSISIPFFLYSLLSTIFTIFGISLSIIEDYSVLCRFIIFVLSYILLALLSYLIIGRIFNNQVYIDINQNVVEISSGDLFDVEGWKVVGCDTHFDTRVDDFVISKNSLHGQLILNHGNVDDINILVKEEAKKLNLTCNNDGLHNFPLGSVIRYDSKIDHQTYLMLSMTKLNTRNEAYTNMVEFINTLSTMWKEINRVYASHDIVLPVLGTGISRFDGNKREDELLKAMLYTLYISGLKFNSRIKIVIYGNKTKSFLYEYKRLFSDLQR